MFRRTNFLLNSSFFAGQTGQLRVPLDVAVRRLRGENDEDATSQLAQFHIRLLRGQVRTRVQVHRESLTLETSSGN